MNAIQLAEKMIAKLEGIQALVNRHFKEGGDKAEDSQKVVINIAINNLHKCISGIENVDLVESEGQNNPETTYLNTRKAMADMERSAGDLTLWKVDIGEYEPDDLSNICDVYSVLVSSDNATLAGDLAQEYCVKNLGRPARKLSTEIVERVDESEYAEILQEIR
jgi:hypothetical protein